jgi:hypothetical protein
MTADFGLRRTAKGPPWGLIFTGVAVALIAGAVWASRQSHLARRIADVEAYSLGGKPCPEVAKAVFEAQAAKAAQVFDFDGLGFARAYGHAECTELASDGGHGWTTYSACKFTAPGLVEVSSPKAGDHYYLTGVGHGVVLSFPKDQAVCEVGEGVVKLSDEAL